MKHTLRLRTAAAAVLALAGSAALTACGSSDDAAATAPAAAAVHAAPSPSAPAATASGTTAGTKATDTDARPAAASAGRAPQGSTGGSAAGTGHQGGTSTGSSSRTAASSGGRSTSTAPAPDAPCTAGGTRIAVQKVSEPLNHLLLTVTNTGSKRCAAFGAPDLGFDGDQAVTRILRDSVPQAVVELEPGRSAYAAIGLSAGDGSGAHGRTVTSLRVEFQDRAGQPVGKQTTVALPAGTYKDDTAFVTYWQTDPAAALTF